MFEFNAGTYGPTLAKLLDARLPELGPGTPNRAVGEDLRNLTIETAFGRLVRQQDMARACFAGLWLYHDFLQESHQISQTIETPTGSYWHGLMHRREPDFGNSKYWFRRVGPHPVFEPLQVAARQLAEQARPHPSAAFLSTRPAWDPFAFVDLCEACIEVRSPERLLCRQIQLCEWQLLFDYCHAQAVGRPAGQSLLWRD